MNTKRQIVFPLILSALFALGIFVGARFRFDENSPTMFSSKPVGYGKVNDVLNYIQDKYVDTITRDKLIDKTLTAMLQSLDPHSAYIPADEFLAVNEPLQGNFDGIGIEFNVIDDTIRVLSVVPGGPADKVGMQAGDKFIRVEGKNIAGMNITSKDVLDRLRGQSGTSVNLSIMRGSNPKLIELSVTRDKIPINSIDISFMVNAEIGYIKLSRFAATTTEDCKNAFAKLQKLGMKKLIFDLRGNPGGYLNAAVELADEFLPKEKLIVYTEGKASRRKNYHSTDKGVWETQPVVILIDDGSASASEIVAGAIQDNDRGTIIGRRSFGKGLVQEQIDFRDSSAVRLTVARYYTPTGRCIQRSYDNGRTAYYHEELDREKSGEFLNADSIKIKDTLKFVTPAGKIVYGGGGITPDVFVPLDTIGNTNYFSSLIYKSILSDFAFMLADHERSKLKKQDFNTFNNTYAITTKIYSDLIHFAEKKGLVTDHKEVNLSESIIKTELKALIARNIWGDDGYYPVVLHSDKTFNKGVQVLLKY